ncbi:MAG: OsmC family peroxiredoxin, partial [Planctomycetota bacterium]
LLDRVARFRGAALVLHDPEDPVVPYAEAERLFSRLRQPRGLVALPGAGHLLAAPEAARHAADLIATWAEPYVGAGVQFTVQRPTPPPDRSTAEVEVLEGSVRHRQTVRIGPHVLTADEPPHLGGRDAGPSPLELLLAALGSCSTITVRMYSDRKGWPLEHVAIRCRLERGRPDEDGYGPTGHRIERVLALRGPLDPAQRKRLHEIADKCPVHKILTRSVPIRTTLA